MDLQTLFLGGEKQRRFEWMMLARSNEVAKRTVHCDKNAHLISLSLSLSLSLRSLFFFSLSLSLSLGFCPSTMCICIVVFPYFRSIALTTRFFFVGPPNTSRCRTLSRETAGALEFSHPATP